MPTFKQTLTRLLQSQGFGTRRHCQNLILEGAVEVDGVNATDPDQIVTTTPKTLTINGQHWPYREHATIMLHKPAGYECSHQPQHHLSVFSLLPAPLITRGIQCAGRLDYDTTGLLLLSDDGAFVHRYSSPKKALGKVYEVTAKHCVSEEQIAVLQAGVLLRGETAPVIPLVCERIDDHRLRLTITEGKYHQVKRMIAAVGNRCEALHRIAVAEFVLPDDLAEGQWKWIDIGMP